MVTPERVSTWISFDRERPDWTYRASATSMPARQAEGVAGVWNKLGTLDAALLADEVGMGKTLQALGVMALLWKAWPKARVLVMAPNRDICQHWRHEYVKFVRTHSRTPRDFQHHLPDVEPRVHEARLAHSLDDLVQEVTQATNEEDGPRFFLTTIHALSGLARDELVGAEKLDVARREARRIHRSLKVALGDGGFDLVVVDEAHYLRNSDGDSQRAHAAREFFGPPESRLGRRALLMTGTPVHASMHDVKAILGYFADVGDLTPETLMGKYMLRRLRRMTGRDGVHDKYSYRHERTSAATFDGKPQAEVFFALYQKQLVMQSVKEGRRLLYGYLEGLESTPSHRQQQPDDARKNAERRDFVRAPDSDILARLASAHRSPPEHPKYDTLVAACMPADAFDARCDVHEHKHLVFVRRIPSVREVARRVNNAYDLQMGRRIAHALAPHDKGRLLKKWQKSGWSRAAFNRLFAQHRAGNDDALDAGDDKSTLGQGDEAPDADVHSQIASLFVVKKDGAHRSTDCSNFGLRLRKPESLLSLLLEPASDHRDGTYGFHYQKKSGDRLRDEYLLAAVDARQGAAGNPARVGEQIRFNSPLPTLLGLMYGLLGPEDRARADRLSVDPALAESFAQFVKNGFVFASPVIVDLYCRYVARRRHDSGSAEDRYRGFLDVLSRDLADSLAFAYFRAALETFEALCENVTDDDRAGWQKLVGLTSPALYASGEVKDRQRLILGFNSPFYPHVLAATSVLQEGVNLHLQCRKVHHYGIAWTPGDNEQRIGRVDRLFGKVNAQLRLHGQAELAIHYPYLARSFDEEQLASFVREKHLVEQHMDACRIPATNAEVDLRHPSAAWRSYLRTPANAAVGAGQPDPYPFVPNQGPSSEYLPGL
ncbi:SNF2-related protein [Rhizobacter sp. Root16D2]|uniref:SNF2-related protein n=1 Tax=Rhizobacter sp. Root16D2 TaxID=1736479 RepID=UPI0006F94D14|nr:SNF2-related protein [Rhizobacter sp. Root16D2]KRB24759.1 hypothetical protein ASE08_00740 [Rhizobacter sp. Root16D2]